jgi:hypothetical protein
MKPLMHRRRTRRVIAHVAIAGLLGLLILTPKLEADRADTTNISAAAHGAAVAASSRLLLPIAEQGK